MKARNTKRILDYLELRGLTAAPSQVWGAVRLVPLIREEVRGDLRLGLRPYAERLTHVTVKGLPAEPKTQYTSFIPHGLIVSWKNSDEPLANWQTQLGLHKKKKDGKVVQRGWYEARHLHRVVKKIDRRAVRMLPMHTAMEGFLAMHFGGPDVAYSYYSSQSLRHGLSPRTEYALSGEGIPDLGEALRLFERHPNQCGVLIYVADVLASAFVVPHPVDYAYMHDALVLDMYGDVFWNYGMMWREPSPFEFDLSGDDVGTLDDLRAAFETARAELADFEVSMGRDLIGRELWTERVYRMGKFELERFITDLTDEDTNHIGESIVRRDGTLEYLKTFRLSAQMVKKGRLLHALAEHEWDLHRAAESRFMSPLEFRDRMVRAGLAFLLRHGAATRL